MNHTETYCSTLQLYILYILHANQKEPREPRPIDIYTLIHTTQHTHNQPFNQYQPHANMYTHTHNTTQHTCNQPRNHHQSHINMYTHTQNTTQHTALTISHAITINLTSKCTPIHTAQHTRNQPRNQNPPT